MTQIYVNFVGKHDHDEPTPEELEENEREEKKQIERTRVDHI